MKRTRLVGEREGLSHKGLGTGKDGHPRVWLRGNLVSCIFDRSGQNNVWLTGMAGGKRGLEQEFQVCPAYCGTELPSQCSVSVTGWFLEDDFSTLPGFPRCLGQHLETQPVPRGDLSTCAWLETPQLLWGQRAGARVKDKEVAPAPPAPVMTCPGVFSEEIFHKAGPYS